MNKAEKALIKYLRSEGYDVKDAVKGLQSSLKGGIDIPDPPIPIPPMPVDDAIELVSKSTLEEFIAYVVNAESDSKYKTSLVYMPKLLTSERGRDFNLISAVKYISRFINNIYDKSGRKSDLTKAAHYLLIEINRLNNE